MFLDLRGQSTYQDRLEASARLGAGGERVLSNHADKEICRKGCRENEHISEMCPDCARSHLEGK